MKTINIFGKKVSIAVILVIALMIGVASAAVYTHYGTLTGTVTVMGTSTLEIIDSTSEEVVLDGTGDLEFVDGSSSFTIKNTGSTVVELLLTHSIDAYQELIDGTIVDINEDGLTLVLSGDRISIVGEDTIVTIPSGIIAEVIVTLDQAVNVVPCYCDINITIDPYGETPLPPSTVAVRLTHKDGEPNWNTTGEISDLTYTAMGDTFNYELDAVGLNAGTSYSLIYYADPWPGINGMVIDEFMADANGCVLASGNIELNMNIPNSADENFGKGGKVWVVPSSHLTDGNSMPMVSWDHTEYIYEYSEILTGDYTDLVRYTDTSI